MNYLPKAKSENIVVQKLPDEVLIYDLMTNRAFCLNDTSAKVFESCNGETTFDDLKRKYQFTDDLIWLALDALKNQNLLDESADYVSPFAGLNRRALIKKAGLATMIALPMILSLTAPLASHAASVATAVAACQPCTQSSECASGNCVPLNQGPGSVCSDGFRSERALRPGETVIIGELVCPSFGNAFCCSGSARFLVPDRCICNG